MKINLAGGSIWRAGKMVGMDMNPYESPKVLDAKAVVALPKKQFLGLAAAEWGILAITFLIVAAMNVPVIWPSLLPPSWPPFWK
jgi:hypothetical protein